METRMMKSEPEHADSETLNLDENHNPYELPEEEDDEEEGEEDSEEEKPAPKNPGEEASDINFQPGFVRGRKWRLLESLPSRKDCD